MKKQVLSSVAKEGVVSTLKVQRRKSCGLKNEQERCNCNGPRRDREILKSRSSGRCKVIASPVVQGRIREVASLVDHGGFKSSGPGNYHNKVICLVAWGREQRNL